jgi:hypothetical protein
VFKGGSSRSLFSAWVGTAFLPPGDHGPAAVAGAAGAGVGAAGRGGAAAAAVAWAAAGGGGARGEAGGPLLGGRVVLRGRAELDKLDKRHLRPLGEAVALELRYGVDAGGVPA